MPDACVPGKYEFLIYYIVCEICLDVRARAARILLRAAHSVCTRKSDGAEY